MILSFFSCYITGLLILYMLKRSDFMESKKRPYEIRGDYLGNYHYWNNEFNIILSRITFLDVPNVMSAYHNKIMEFEVIFEDKGLNLFDERCYLRVVIFLYLDSIVAEACNEYYTMLKLSAVPYISYPYLLHLVSRIKKKIAKIRKFSLEDLPIILERFLRVKPLYGVLDKHNALTFVNKSLCDMEALGLDLGLNNISMIILNDAWEMARHYDSIAKSNGERRIEDDLAWCMNDLNFSFGGNSLVKKTNIN